MYEDPARYSLLFQTYVQLTMLERHNQPCDKDAKIMERSLLRIDICGHGLSLCFINHNSVLINFCHFNFYSLIYELTKHIHRTTALTYILPPSSVRGTASWRTCTQRARCPTPNTPSFQNGLTISCLARNLTSM